MHDTNDISISGRTRLLFLLWLLAIAAGIVSRAAIAIVFLPRFEAGALIALLARGVALDSAVSVLVVAPIALVVSLSGGALLRRKWFRLSLLTSVGGAMVFSGFVEFFFFEEFDARFNHVAIDYLLFPREVAANVWESYPVPIYLGASLLAGALCALGIERLLRGRHFDPAPWSRRLLGAGGVLAASVAALPLISVLAADEGPDRRAVEIAGNGLVQLVRAYESASLDYECYYRTAPAVAAGGLAAAPQPVVREFKPLRQREQPLDVVVVLGESFGSEFVSCLNGQKACAPGFDRWAKQGLLLTNLVATGNRTVRGLEGVLCSFVPLPGDSIWKRDKSDDVATIARVLKSKGYRTEFVYGGDGMFDSMRSFALRNGWDQFLDDSIVGESCFPDDAFRTAWGVADETIFAKLLERQRAAAREGQPFFGTALTVSNHKPFLTPDSEVRGLRSDKLVETALAGVALLGASWLAWRLLAHPWGRVATGTALALVWSGFLVYGWLEVQPRDSRESAVRYADRALADYLEQARAEGLLDHTVVLFVGDHGARVYGSESIPAASYRIPALFLAPDAELHGATISKLCSQVDLAPTLLSIAGVDYMAPFFGEDLLASDPDGPGRAYLIHNRDVGLLTDTTLTVLGLRKTTTHYRRTDRASDRFTPAASDPELSAEADRVAAVFQRASRLYEGGGYRLTNAP